MYQFNVEKSLIAFRPSGSWETHSLSSLWISWSQKTSTWDSLKPQSKFCHASLVHELIDVGVWLSRTGNSKENIPTFQCQHPKSGRPLSKSCFDTEVNLMGSSVGNHTCCLRVSSSASLALLCPRGTSGAAEVMLTLCLFELPFRSSACKEGHWLQHYKQALVPAWSAPVWLEGCVGW